MRIIHDGDVRTFTDPDGGTLTLLVSPRKRDVDAVGDVERKEAFAQLADLKASGVDTDKMMADATDDEKARAADAAQSDTGDRTRRARLDALAIKLIIGDETTIGHAQVVAQYDIMDLLSAAWVDAQVATVWESAIPTDESARGPAADAAPAEAAAVVAAD